MVTPLRLRSIGIVLAILCSAHACGQSLRPLRRARSDNRRFELRVEPGRAGRGSTRPCRASLRERGERGRRAVWEAELVNATAPTRAVLRDDGAFVATFDEYRRGGAAHAVVIYDARGKLVHDFDLRELLREGDWKQVKLRGRAIEWLDGAKIEFSEDQTQLTIRLRWKRELRIQLERGELISKDGKKRRADDEIPPEIAAVFESDSAGQAPAYERIAEKLIRDRQADGAPLSEQELAALMDEAKRIAGAGDQSRDADHTVEAAGNSAEVGAPVPQPDPGEHIDYIAWAAQFTSAPDAPAQELLAEAMEKTTRDAEDYDLINAAMKGDPDALASPEVQAWLEANRDALADMRAATAYDYDGWPLRSDDGMMVGALLPHLGALRELTRVSVVEAKQLEADGRFDDALDYYMDALASGGQVGRGVTLIENLVGQAMQSSVSGALLDSLAGPAGDNVDYDDLADRIEASLGAPRPVAQTIQFERAMMMDFMQRTYERDETSGQVRVSPEGPGLLTEVTGMSQDDPLGVFQAAAMLATTSFDDTLSTANNIYDRMTEGMQLPYPEGREVLSALEQEVSAPEFKARNALLSGVVPSVSRYRAIDTRTDATRRATLLVAELKAYRQRTGAYPDSLADLGAGASAIDPFTGQPFAYHPQGDDFSLYSLSANGTDDGGTHDLSLNSNDLVFWPRPN